MILVKESVQNQLAKINQNADLTLQAVNLHIYPCCFQIFSHKQSVITQKPFSAHQCFMNHQSRIQLCSVPLAHFQSDQINSKGIPSVIELTAKSCSLCLKSSFVEETLQFIYCEICKKYFCTFCNQQIHSKGKFSTHRTKQINAKLPHSQSSKAIFLCSIHQKPRAFILKQEIVCQKCIKQQKSKYLQMVPQLQNAEASIIAENVIFSSQYFKDVYHKEANHLSQLKQKVNSFYFRFQEILTQKYKSNLSQIQKLQKAVQLHFNKMFKQFNQFTTELHLIQSEAIKRSSIIPLQCLRFRSGLIQEKFIYIKTSSDKFISQISYDYKIGDQEKSQLLIDQFMKMFSIYKTKREEQGGECIRSCIKNNIKSSRLASRPSSNRLTASKDHSGNNSNAYSCRAQSSFRNNENSSVNKTNSICKLNSQKTALFKNQESSKPENFKVTQEVLAQGCQQMEQIKRTFLQDKKKKCNQTREINTKDIANIQKSQFQDLNLNLKKFMTQVKQPTAEFEQQNKFQISKPVLSSSSLLKQKLYKNTGKSHKIVQSNPKGLVYSSQFTQVIEEKNKHSPRKNYFACVQQTEEKNKKQNKIECISLVASSVLSSIQSSSSSNSSKPSKIKSELVSNVVDSLNYPNNLIENCPILESHVSQNIKSSLKQQTSGLSKKFGKLIPFINENQSIDYLQKDSEEQKITFELTEFTTQSLDLNSIVTNQLDQGEKSCSNIINLAPLLDNTVQQDLGKLSCSQSKTLFQQKLFQESKNCEKPNKNLIQIQKLENQSQFNTLTESLQILKDNTNNSKIFQNNQKLKLASQPQKLQKKKPDFMDMRERIRKPNYLSTKLSNSVCINPLSKPINSRN